MAKKLGLGNSSSISGNPKKPQHIQRKNFYPETQALLPGAERVYQAKEDTEGRQRG